MSEPVSLKAKLLLAGFGTLSGVILLAIAVQFLMPDEKGTEFQSLKDVRLAMLKGDALDSGVPDPNDSFNEKSQAKNLRGIIVPHPDDNIIFDLMPKLSTTFMRSAVTTNSCGQRDAERPIVKPPHTFRIALLGDSFVFGWGVKQDESFAALLEKKLNERAKDGTGFEVLNFGIPGYSTFQEVAKFEESGLDFDPDAVLVFFIENDFGLPFYVRDIYNPGSIVDSVKFARLTWQALDPKLEEEKLRMTNYDPNRALKKLSELTRARGIPLYVTINPKENEEHLRRQLWVLKSPGVQYFSMRRGFVEARTRRNIPEDALTLSFDPHPSALRHDLYADLLTTSFLRYLKP